MSHETLSENMVGAVMTVYEREPIQPKQPPPGPRRLPPLPQAASSLLGPEKHLVTGYVRAVFFPPAGGMLFVLEVIFPTNEVRGRGDIVTVGTGGPIGSMRYSMIDHPAEAEIPPSDLDEASAARIAAELLDAYEASRGAVGGSFENLSTDQQAPFYAMAHKAREIFR